jgi:hypothetical protein
MTYGAPPTGDPPPQGPWPQQPWAQQVVSEKGTRRGGFVGFMTSLPGVLTAVAGLITAASGGLGLYYSQGDDGGGGGGETIIYTPAPVPEGDGQVDTEDLDAGLPDASADDEITALADGCLAGVQSDCDTLLYVVAMSCSDGDMTGCDALFLISAYGSEYEDYGATCGGRFYDWTYAGDCISAPL